MDGCGKSPPPPRGFDPWILQLVTSRYTDCAVAAPRKLGTVGDSIGGSVESGIWPVDQGVFQDSDFVLDTNDATEINLNPVY